MRPPDIKGDAAEAWKLIEALGTRFSSKVQREPEGDCIIWIGARTSKGYGHFKIGGRDESVHRIIYVLAHGPIPDGLQIDHVASRGCRSRACVNILHLEAVTCRENLMRGDTAARRFAEAERCPRNHVYTGTQAKGRWRLCKVCKADKQRERRAQRRLVNA